MIVIEGADGVGKTTLAKQLEREIGLLYRHLSRLPDGFHRYRDYLPLFNKRFVCDRLWLSELAYCFARQETSCPCTPAHVRLLVAQMALHGAYHVVITADDSVIEDRYNSSGQMYDLPTILRANEWYSMASELEYSIDHIIHITPTKPNILDFVPIIIASHKERQNELQ